MTPTIEEYLEGDLIPQVESFNERFRAFGFVPEEGTPKEVLRDLQKGVDNCYFDFKGDFDSPYLGHWRILVDTLEYLENVGVPDMVGWKCEHIFFEGDRVEKAYLGATIKEKHIKYYLPKYRRYHWVDKDADTEWNPRNGFYQKQGEYFILPLDISDLEFGEVLRKRVRINRAVSSALEDVRRSKEEGIPTK